ncbi:MAG: hypothetical protein ACE5JP_02570 [Candidatus Bipolaricaulia bacterium]
MKAIKVMMWKEARSVLHNIPLVLFIYALLLSGVYLVSYYGQSLLGDTALMVMFGGIFFLSEPIFYGERLNKTFVHLLASPITIRELFLGKAFTIFIISYLMEWIVVIISGSIAWFNLGELPSLSLALMTLIIIPIWGFVLIELFGIAYALFGSNSIEIGLLLIGLVSGILLTAREALRMGVQLYFWVPPIAGIGIGLALLLGLLVGRISKERMMRVLS